MSRRRFSLTAVLLSLFTTPSFCNADQFVLFDVTFNYTKDDADNSIPSKSHYYVKGDRLNKDRPRDWTAPVDYRNGTVHIRAEVIDKPEGGEPTTWTICYIPNKGKGNGYGCTGTKLYREKGVYERDVSMKEFWENDSIIWSEGIKQMDLVIKDDSGGSGHAHKRKDSEKFFPTTMRITVVQVSAGAKYDPSLVPNLSPSNPDGAKPKTEKEPVNCCEPVKPALEPSATSARIGYTTFRTDLPGGRHANVVTMRASIASADGIAHRELAPELSREPNTWTQFGGWSPDGRLAIVGRGWESAENARWEEEHQSFRYNAEGWLYDMYLIDLATGKTTNLTSIDRVSVHNTGLFFWPNDPTKLGFQTLIDGDSHPFRMDRDGKNKLDLTKDSKEFAYGFSASPDGRRIAYHKSYQVFLADSDGSNARKIETGQPFNFAPQWSPDGSHLLFVAGEHYNCHPHVVRADGSGLRKLADRGRYRGVVDFLDVPDFHHGSSDIPVWSVDGTAVFHTAKIGSNVELFRVSLDGRSERLTEGQTAALHYHPQPSPDGYWLAYGSKRDGVRDLYVMLLSDRLETRVSHMEKGHAAMWPHWEPKSRR